MDSAPSNAQSVEIPMGHVRELSRANPSIWSTIERNRLIRESKWAPQCYYPVSRIMQMPSFDDPLSATYLAAVSAWRLTKGVYHFDPTILAELRETNLDPKLPSDFFLHLPEWSCFVVIPPTRVRVDGVVQPMTVQGFFAFIDDDGEGSLYLFVLPSLMEGINLVPPTVYAIGDGTVEDMMSKGDRRFAKLLRHQLPSLADHYESHVLEGPARSALDDTFLSLTLYLCSVNAEFVDRSGVRNRPSNPRPRRIKKRKTLLPHNQPTNWDVAFRLGAALRHAKSSARSTDQVGETSQRKRRAHVRRAHWHSFWRGPRKEPDKRELVVKWLPPIPIGLPDELVPTLRAVAE